MTRIEKPTYTTNSNSNPSSSQPFMRLLPWVGLLLLGFVEAVVLTDARLGLVLHAVILLGLITYRTYLARIPAGRNLCLALCLLPIMRMLSLGLPYALLPKDSWHFLVSVPMLIAVIMALRYMAWRDVENPEEADPELHDIRVQPAALPALLLVGCGGLVLGQMVFSGMKLLALKDLSPTNLSSAPLLALLPVTSGLALSAICEEIIFRSMIQSSASQVIGGRTSVVFTALLYTVMSLGNMTTTDLPSLAIEFSLVFVIALLFGVIVFWSGSIVGTSLAHIVLNITTFVLLPAFALSIGIALPVLMAGSALLGACGLVWLALRQNQ